MNANTKQFLRYLTLQLIKGSVAAVTLLLVAAMPANANKFSLGGEKPMPVEEAFIATAVAVDRNTVELSFDIADGYYLYRDKTKITSVSENTTIGEPEFPKALVVNDEFFGDSAIYRNLANITLPVIADGEATEVALNVQFQGCADIGLCYPPTDTQINVILPPPPQAQSSSLSTLLNDTKDGSSLFSNQKPLLSPEQAFIPTATVDSANNNITVDWVVQPDYYLYRDKMTFEFADNAAEVSFVSFSEAQIETDEFFGDVPVFREIATATLSVENAQAGTAMLNIGYQGCADIGVCFPPSTISLPVDLIDSQSANKTTLTTGAVTDAVKAPQTEQDRIRAKLSSSSLWINAASFFVLGLLLSFTPCVFPMIPILSSLILGQGKDLSTGKAFGLSLTYVLAMAVTYTSVGIFIGLSGYNLQAWFQNPIILSVFAAIFVLLSLSMFGFYEIQMPNAIQSRLNNWSNKQEGGNWIGVAIMGVLSALIVGPCVTAPLVGALIYIAETGDATVGGVALFSMSMGMGLPLLVIGTSAGKIMPKAGAWMDITKVLFGLAMLAMAIWMLSRFVPSSVTMALSATLAIFGGMYLAFTDRFGDSIRWLSRGLGFAIALYGAALATGLLSGNHSLTTPLANIGGGVQHEELEFERIKTVADLDEVLQQATDANQYVMLDYYADWCVSCKEMEAYTFTDADVQASLANVRLIQVDVTKNDTEDQAMLKRFGLFGPPAILFFKPGGTELSNARVVGYVKAKPFNEHLSTTLQ